MAGVALSQATAGWSGTSPLRYPLQLGDCLECTAKCRAPSSGCQTSAACPEQLSTKRGPPKEKGGTGKTHWQVGQAFGPFDSQACRPASESAPPDWESPEEFWFADPRLRLESPNLNPPEAMADGVPRPL
jgi:hypothetical protein